MLRETLRAQNDVSGLRQSFLKVLYLCAEDSDQAYGFRVTLPPKGWEGLGEAPLKQRADPASTRLGLVRFL